MPTEPCLQRPRGCPLNPACSGRGGAHPPASLGTLTNAAGGANGRYQVRPVLAMRSAERASVGLKLPTQPLSQLKVVDVGSPTRPSAHMRLPSTGRNQPSSSHAGPELICERAQSGTPCARRTHTSAGCAGAWCGARCDLRVHSSLQLLHAPAVKGPTWRRRLKATARNVGANPESAQQYVLRQ